MKIHTNRLCQLLLIFTLCQQAAAQTTQIAIRTQIALQISPFFNFTNPHSTNNYCLYKEIDDELNEEKLNAAAKNISPAIQLKTYRSIKQIPKDCQFVLLDSDEPSDILTITKEIRDTSLLIGFGVNAINYGHDVGLVKNGNHIDIYLNLRSLRLKKITPNPQLIKLSKVVIQ